jgi:hypothetical protein
MRYLINGPVAHTWPIQYPMPPVVIENPILNSPFEEPRRHFRFSEEGITNEIIDGRRVSSYFIPIPKPRTQGGKSQRVFDTEWTQERIEENKFMWVPLSFKPEQINHDFHWLLCVGRLKPGVSLTQAQANMDAVTRHIAEAYPKSNANWGGIVEPYQNTFLRKDMHTAIWVFFGAVVVVLLIVCANVANLLLPGAYRGRKRWRFAQRREQLRAKSSASLSSRA